MTLRYVMLCYIYYSVLFNFVVFCSILLHLATPACWIMLVMPTRRFLPSTPFFLGSCAIYIHSNVPMAPFCYLAAMAGGAPRRKILGSAHTPLASIHTSITSFLAPESQKTQFFSKIRSLHRQNSTLRCTQML